MRYAVILPITGFANVTVDAMNEDDALDQSTALMDRDGCTYTITIDNTTVQLSGLNCIDEAEVRNI